MPQSPSYQFEIAPLMSLPLSRSPLFSYQSSEEIALGSLVKIPFGKQFLDGVVFASKPLRMRTPHWMKSPKHVIHPALLTPQQLALAENISHDTYTPLGIVLKHFVVRPPNKISSDAQDEVLESPSPTRATLTKREHALLRSFLKAQPGKPILWKNQPYRHLNVLVKLLHTIVKKDGQVLMLVPEVALAKWWYETLSSYFEKVLLTEIHSRLTPATLKQHWWRIRAGRAQIIIGTRQALFAPFQNLGLILQLDAEDEVSYSQWEMSPRYQTHLVAQQMSILHQATFLLVTPTPSLTLDHWVYQQYTIPPQKSKKSEHLLVNLRILFKPGKDLALTPDLLAAMKQTLSKNEKVFLIARQQGLASFSLCLQCKQVLRCPQCTRTLTPISGGIFFCFNGHYRTSAFPSCPHCGGLQFKNIGSGTEKIESLVQRYFPSYRVIRLDTKATKRAVDLTRLIQKIQIGNYDILIGTSHHTLLPSLPETGLVAMIEADTALSFPDFRSEERLAGHLVRASLFVQDNPGGKVLLQTFSPEQAVFEEFVAQNTATTKKRLFEERTLLSYPPVGRFIRLDCIGKSTTEALQKSLEITKELAHLGLPFVVKPIQSTKKIFSRRSSLLLRFPKREPLPKILHQFFLVHSKDFIVEIDPLHLT